MFSNVKGKNPFKDKRVRQAFYQAVDIENIKSRVMRNAATDGAICQAVAANLARIGVKVNPDNRMFFKWISVK